MKTNNNHKLLRTIVCWFLLIIVVPAVVYISWKYADRHYYINSLIIISCTMIPFFIRFERRHVEARELVILAVLCAIAVISRAVFIWLPSFKPITAIIMLTGVALGAEAGFICGATSAFVSNFIFGQGPWTPWQMLAFGFAGFIAGLIFGNKQRAINPTPPNLTIFSVICVVLLVGPLLDTSSLLTESATISVDSAIAIYGAGFPLNIVHACATAAVMIFFSKTFLEKLDRIKLKYGMIDLED